MNSKSDYAYNEIKNKIIQGGLAPLSDIVEERLQEELQVSRTPIREAIQKLSKEGFVYIYARKGTIVSAINVETIHSVYQARMLNEPYLSKEVCYDVSEEWLLHMKEQLENSPFDPSGMGYRDYYMALDYELHSTILSYCKNQFLKDALRVVNDHSQRLRLRTSRYNEDLELSIKEHIAIVDAFLARDPERVEQVTRTHVISSRQDAFKYNTDGLF